ncbi:MAG: cellulose biosynthesis protein BcsS [Hyphomicrobium sp.]
MFFLLAGGLRAGSVESLQPGPDQPKYGWREVWNGGDAMRDVWLLYSGVTLAPWSEHIYAPGFRLRAQAGYGEYRYSVDTGGGPTEKKGDVTYADALVGYHWRTGALTAKVFGGISAIEHKTLKNASDGRVAGLEYGPKGMLELWLNVGDTQFTSLNLAFTTAHGTASARWRYGFKLAPEFSVGPEVRFDTNAFRYQRYGEILDSYLGRAGLFMTYKWPGIELSLAGGLAANVAGNQADDVSPYGTVNLLFQY